ISHVHTKKEWMISYRYMNMYMTGLTNGTQPEEKNDVFANYLMSPEKMTMQMHMLMGMYGITNRLTAMAMFHYVANSMEMTMFTMNHVHGNTVMSSPVHHMNTAGMSDIKLHALYGIIQRNTCQLVISAGVSIPTGTIQLQGNSDDPMYPDKHYPYGMQLGSGTVDLLPGISYLYQKGSLATSINVSGTYRTGYNSLGYKLGNEAIVNGWMAYRWLSLVSSSIRLQAITTDRIEGHDPALFYYTEPSTNPANYGGKKVNAYIGSSLHFRGVLRNNRLGVEFGVPLYQDLNGIQLKQQYALNASWSFIF
ncbi:MAG TPA: transporter, partial [Bacteroidia bacterium]|nr:transporter [Bacteroidia bacterium]